MSMHGWEVEVDQPDGSNKTMDACLQWDIIGDGNVEATVFTPIEELAVRGELEIEVVEVSLAHMKLGDTPTSYGTAQLGGGEGLLVVTEDDEGNMKVSLRAADGNVADLTPDTSLQPRLTK